MWFCFALCVCECNVRRRKKFLERKWLSFYFLECFSIFFHHFHDDLCNKHLLFRWTLAPFFFFFLGLLLLKIVKLQQQQQQWWQECAFHCAVCMIFFLLVFSVCRSKNLSFFFSMKISCLNDGGGVVYVAKCV